MDSKNQSCINIAAENYREGGREGGGKQEHSISEAEALMLLGFRSHNGPGGIGIELCWAH